MFSDGIFGGLGLHLGSALLDARTTHSECSLDAVKHAHGLDDAFTSRHLCGLRSPACPLLTGNTVHRGNCWAVGTSSFVSGPDELPRCVRPTNRLLSARRPPLNRRHPDKLSERDCSRQPDLYAYRSNLPRICSRSSMAPHLGNSVLPKRLRANCATGCCTIVQQVVGQTDDALCCARRALGFINYRIVIISGQRLGKRPGLASQRTPVAGCQWVAGRPPRRGA